MKGYENDFRNRISASLRGDLELWGRFAGAAKKRGISPTYVICARMARAAGVVPYDASPGMLDGALRRSDAVEAAWVRAMLSNTERALLAGYYVYRVRPHILCRALGVRYVHFDDRMEKAANLLDAEL